MNVNMKQAAVLVIVGTFTCALLIHADRLGMTDRYNKDIANLNYIISQQNMKNTETDSQLDKCQNTLSAHPMLMVEIDYKNYIALNNKIHSLESRIEFLESSNSSFK